MSKSLPIVFALSVLSCIALPHANAQEGSKPANDPVGYFLGLSVGQQMKASGFRPTDIDVEALIAGFNDGIQGKEAGLTDDQLLETQNKITDLLKQRQAEMIKIKKEDNQRYLAANAKKEGVETLPGGVQYKVLKKGDGTQSPVATDTVKVHYTGRLTNDTIFDSSVKRGEPATFRVNQVIQGWQMALQKMKVGDKWMLYIPSELAYGEFGKTPIGPNELLVFEVELLAIQ